uniref:Reverse transcriptase Ty1/copia-type domain-containing protein n=1 Tax=Nicotiana tabacum TaxID=4097 RepID=A0A1S4BCG3_TOBAC|nr:PREDICTED: uncharacterized protein LOC107806847 [Nicotiana tabacum]
MVNVRILVALAPISSWYIFQMDVHNAFLQGDLVEDVYMQIPDGFLSQGEYKKVVNNKADVDDQQLEDKGGYQRIQSHLVAAMRVVRYIKNAPGLGLFMPAASTLKLTAYCDSDWGTCVETRKSVTGYLVKFGDALIS